MTCSRRPSPTSRPTSTRCSMRSNMSRSAVVLGRAMGLTLPTLPIVNADPAGEDAFDPPKPVRGRLRQLNALDVALFRRYSEGF